MAGRGGAAAALRAEPAGLPEAPRPEADRHLRVVRPEPKSEARRRRDTRLVILAVATMAVAVAFGLVYLHVRSAQKQFQLDRSNAALQTAANRYEDLRIAAAQASAPGNIMRAAQRLGMHEPSYERFVAGVAGAASTTPAVPSVRNGALAPAGISDWSGIKSDVQGIP